MAISTTSPVTSTLLPEVLGFAPQLLLDDIINIANNAIYHCVDALEPFLYRWAEERALKLQAQGKEWSGESQIEQGLVSFQTLLEQHVDIAFDFFEVWSLRNIFAFPADLPVVVPHQKDLDLTTSSEREDGLFKEIEELRRRVENQRRLKSLLVRAIAKAESRAVYSNNRLQSLAFLEPLADESLSSLPANLDALHNSLKSLTSDLPSSLPTTHPSADPTKPPWQTSQRGYLQWAVNKLVENARSERKSLGGTQSAIGLAAETANSIGRVTDVRRALMALEEPGDDDELPDSSQ